MGYLHGFKITFGKMFKGTRSGATVTVPYVKDSGPKRHKPERLHGRHVLNRYEDGMEKCIGCELCAGRVPGQLHLRPRRRQPRRRPRVARRALRLRLRDQLPALHPLRSLRGGLPHRGHHRVEALRVLLHQPGRRDLHEGRAGRRRRRPAAAPPVGGLVRHRHGGRQHLRLGAGHRPVGVGRLRGRGGLVRRAGLRCEGAGAGPDRPRSRLPPPQSLPATTTMSPSDHGGHH